MHHNGNHNTSLVSSSSPSPSSLSSVGSRHDSHEQEQQEKQQQCRGREPQHQSSCQDHDGNTSITHETYLSGSRLNKRRNAPSSQLQHDQQPTFRSTVSFPNNLLQQPQLAINTTKNHQHHHYTKIVTATNVFYVGIVVSFIWITYMVQLFLSNFLNVKDSPAIAIHATAESSVHHPSSMQQNFDPFYVSDGDDYNVQRIWNYKKRCNLLSLLLTTTFPSKNNDMIASDDKNKDDDRTWNKLDTTKEHLYSNEEEYGVYRFIDSPYCAKLKNNDDGTTQTTTRSNSDHCHIHFPTACTPKSCLLTLKGHKDIILDEQGNTIDDDMDDKPARVGVDDDQNPNTNHRVRKLSSLSATVLPHIRKVPNQDRIVLITPPPLRTTRVRSSRIDYNVTSNEVEDNSMSSSSWFMAGLFDGHGDYGHYCSQAAIYELFMRLLQKQQQLQRRTSRQLQRHHNLLQRQDSPETSNGLYNNITDTTWIESVFIKADESNMIRSITSSGTTAILAWQVDSVVYMASTGDSTGLLIQWNHNTDRAGSQARNQSMNLANSSSQYYRIMQSAIKHKPADPTERQRIESHGGYVYIPPSVQGLESSSRVIFLVPKNETTGILPELSQSNAVEDDPNSMMYIQMSIAMSRSIGDLEAKRRHLLIPDPSIVAIDLNDYRDDTTYEKSKESSFSHNQANNPKRKKQSSFFVILGTDGLFDVLYPDDIIIPIGRALFDYQPDISPSTSRLRHHRTKYDANGTRTSLLRHTCENIIHQAKMRWSMETQNTYRDDISLLVKQIDL